MSYYQFLWECVKPCTPAFTGLMIGVAGLAVALISYLLGATNKAKYAVLADAGASLSSIVIIATTALTALAAVLAVFGIGR
jgi:hypothetical protein